MFRNLCYSKEFLDSNFCDFFADNGQGEKKEDHSYVVDSLNDFYGPEPYFERLLPTTLSEACCQNFLRQHNIPALARDYYLSKLFQFINEALRARCLENYDEDGVRAELNTILDEIPDSHLPPNKDPAELNMLFVEVFRYADGHPPAAALKHLREQIQLYVDGPPLVPTKPKKRGRPTLQGDRRAEALEAYNKGATTHELAQILHSVKYPTAEQKNGVSSILRYYRASLAKGSKT